MPPKQESKKSTKKGGFSLSPKVEIKAYELETAVLALLAPDNYVVFKSICSLDFYIGKNENSALSELMKYDILGTLLKATANPKIDTTSKRMICKVIQRYFQKDYYTRMMAYRIDETKCLVDRFIENTDKELLIQLIDIIHKLCIYEKFIENFCREEALSKIFYVFMDGEDIELTIKCLKILQTMVACGNVQELICNMKDHQIGILSILLRNDILRPAIMVLFKNLSKMPTECIHKAIAESESIERFIELLNNPKWSSLQNATLDIIHNCMRNYDYAVQIITSKEFLKFMELSCKSVHHALACITLLTEFSKVAPGRQALYDLRIIEQIPKFYKFKCPYINIKICEALTHLCKSCFIAEDSISSLYIKELGKMMNMKDFPWDPYRQAPIQPLHSFLIAKPSIVQSFEEHKLFKNFKEALLNRHQLHKTSVKLIGDIFYNIITNSPAYQEQLLSKETYSVFVKKYQCYYTSNMKNENYKKYMDMILATMEQEKFRKMFIELEGHIFIVQTLRMFKNKTARKLLEFIKLIVKYSEISRALLQAEIAVILTEMSRGVPDAHNSICRSLINDLYMNNLSIKFFETNELEIHDVIKTDFIVCLGPTPSSFPYNNGPENEKINEFYTMIVVNMNDNAKIHQGADTRLENCISQIMRNDEILYKYIKELRTSFRGETGRLSPKKIEKLAHYVCKTLSASIPNINRRIIEHRNELKKLLKSNYVPLGLLKIGGLIERAILFKVLADHLGLPCTLTRSKKYKGIAWNEIPLDCKFEVETDSDDKLEIFSAQQSAMNTAEQSRILSGIDRYFQDLQDETDLKNRKDSIPVSMKIIDIEATTMKSYTPSATDPKNKDDTSPTEHDPNDPEDVSSRVSSDFESIFEPSEYCYRTYIVDLKNDFGKLYAYDSKKGFMYREQVSSEDQRTVRMQYEIAKQALIGDL